MAYHNTSGQHIYANADRSQTYKVKPGEEPPAGATVLLVAAGDTVTDEQAADYGLEKDLSTEAPKPQSALEREKAGLDDAVKRRAFDEAKARRATIAELEAHEAARAKPAQTTERVTADAATVRRADEAKPADKGR